jgi:hypothetical protein
METGQTRQTLDQGRQVRGRSSVAFGWRSDLKYRLSPEVLVVRPCWVDSLGQALEDLAGQDHTRRRGSDRGHLARHQGETS